MNFTPPCFIYSQDAALRRRLSSYLASIATVTEIPDARKVEVAMLHAQLGKLDPSSPRFARDGDRRLLLLPQSAGGGMSVSGEVGIEEGFGFFDGGTFAHRNAHFSRG